MFMVDTAFAQRHTGELEDRVRALENYVETFQPTLRQFSENMQNSIRDYTQGLESSLKNYSKQLQTDLEERLQNLDRRIIMLDPVAKSYQTMDTRTGTFLIAVERMEPLEDGFRLHLNIGNPNFADYKDFKLRLVWGRKWMPSYPISYAEWRQSLTGAEYTFQGALQKGMWNPVKVDLVPAGAGQLGHIECEMEVSSVELQFK